MKNNNEGSLKKITSAIEKVNELISSLKTLIYNTALLIMYLVVIINVIF